MGARENHEQLRVEPRALNEHEHREEDVEKLGQPEGQQQLEPQQVALEGCVRQRAVLEEQQQLEHQQAALEDHQQALDVDRQEPLLDITLGFKRLLLEGEELPAARATLDAADALVDDPRAWAFVGVFIARGVRP